jgi:hypothetical protein
MLYCSLLFPPSLSKLDVLCVITRHERITGRNRDPGYAVRRTTVLTESCVRDHAVEVFFVDAKRIQPRSLRLDPVGVGGAQLEARVVCRKVEPAQPRLVHGAERAGDTKQQVERIFDTPGREGRSLRRQLEGESAAPIFVEKSAQIGILESHVPLYAPSPERKPKLPQHEFGRARLTGQRLSLSELIHDVPARKRRKATTSASTRRPTTRTPLTREALPLRDHGLRGLSLLQDEAETREARLPRLGYDSPPNLRTLELAAQAKAALQLLIVRARSLAGADAPRSLAQLKQLRAVRAVWLDDAGFGLLRSRGC